MTTPSVGIEPGAIPASGTHVTQSPERRHRSLWLRELPFAPVLILIVVGVAYTSFSKQPIITYWEVLAPIIGLVCIAAGWQNAKDRAAQWRLVWTQALHWLAFIFVMNMQRSFNAGTTALAIFLLLALGTFTAGVHVLSWQICLLGLGPPLVPKRARARLPRSQGYAASRWIVIGLSRPVGCFQWPGRVPVREAGTRNRDGRNHGHRIRR
jgi:hypothetical protein